MKECKIIYFLILFLSASPGFCQQNVSLPPGELKENGKAALQMADYFSASEFYYQYCNLKPRDFEAAYQLAEAYRLSRQYELAKEWYLKCYQAGAKKYILGLFYYAQMQKITRNYASAQEHFTRFLNEYTGSDDKIIALANIEMEGCKLAANTNFEEAESNAIIAHLNNSINKGHIELSPTYIDESTILYSSFNEDSLRYYKLTDTIKTRKFFKAFKFGNNWEGENPIEEPFNDPKKHDGNGVYSEDEKRFYFTKCDFNNTAIYECQIYLSQKADKWQTPVLLDKKLNEGGNTNTQPTIQKLNDSVDVIYFVSNRAGGYGGMDIWRTEYNHQTQEMAAPINLGKNVNTAFDELTPFYYQPNGTLYFSSTGWAGFGGFDIFKSKGNLNEWTIPENEGYPINSSMDDLYYIKNKKNENEGFLVSNRNGATPFKSEHCCDDIFSYEKQEEQIIKYIGVIYNASLIERILEMEDDEKKNEMIANEANYIIPNQKVVMYQFSGNNEPIPVDSSITNEKGEVFFGIKKDNRYKLLIEREGFFNKHHEFSTKNVVGTLKQHIGLVELTLEPIVIKNIYYPFDEWYLTKNSKITIDTTVYKILIENPKLIIELSSHTDNFGTDAYNDNLSQQRAESVVNYLISKKIDKRRLRAKGYGERRPIAPNAYSDGSDNPEGRQRNRRTEFRIIGKIDGASEIIYEE